MEFPIVDLTVDSGTAVPYDPSTNIYTSKHPIINCTADIIYLRRFPGEGGTIDHKILLVKRANPPYANMWALPGGFINIDEEPIDAARRELQEETGLVARSLNFVGYYADPKRDPRGRVISFAFVGGDSAFEQPPEPVANDDAAEVQFFYVNDLPMMAFDHEQIFTDYRNGLRYA